MVADSAAKVFRNDSVPSLGRIGIGAGHITARGITAHDMTARRIAAHDMTARRIAALTHGMTARRIAALANYYY